MANISQGQMKKIWLNVNGYEWRHFYPALDQSLEEDVISYQDYQNMKYAAQKLENLPINFPTSPYELLRRMDHYM